jgi:TRAP-type C4-dicarboxylate transport system permease small subunit
MVWSVAKTRPDRRITRSLTARPLSAQVAKMSHHLVLSDAFLKKIEYATAVVGGGVVFLLMLGGVSEIVLRSVFNAPIPGYVEAVRMGVVAFAILPVSYCYQRDGHLKMDLVIRATSGRENWVLRTVGVAIALAFVIAITPGVFDYFNNAYVIGDSTMSMEWPTWPSKLAAVFGLGLFGCRLVVDLIAHLRMVANPDLEPIAIPAQLNPLEEAVD